MPICCAGWNCSLEVTVGLAPSLAVGKPEILFTRTALDDSSGPAYGMTADYDVSLDGQRFIMRKHNPDNSQIPAVRIVLNWFDELKRLTSTK